MKKKGCLGVVAGFIGFCVVLAAGVVIVRFAMGLPIVDTSASTDVSSISSAPEKRLTKQDVGEIDKDVWKKITLAVTANNDIMATLDAYALGKISQLDFYDYCKDQEDFLRDLAISFPYYKDENIQPYLHSCEQFVISIQVIAKSLKKYLEDSNIKYLSEANEMIEQTEASASVVAGNRAVFLKAFGYTKEEIEAIANQIDFKSVSSQPVTQKGTQQAPVSRQSELSETASSQSYDYSSRDIQENIEYYNDINEELPSDRFSFADSEILNDSDVSDQSDLDGIN